MHEIGIIKSLIEEIFNQAKKNNLKKINKICLSIEKDSHLTEESIKFLFENFTKETILKNTKLEIKKGDQKGIILDLIEGTK